MFMTRLMSSAVLVVIALVTILQGGYLFLQDSEILMYLVFCKLLVCL